ncbi:unnamed protein product [Paramecium sonneborni]|uniref:Uncharacterized protein n=1 Tax=Paramecium sonneborni TaxID=65129 RepID=A0A8S1RA95_9CILI|nr:unnamed protein product [Paramecium sonneborni]
MNFRQEADIIVDSIFNQINISQNERIINNLRDYQQLIKENLFELDNQEDDLKIKEVYLSKLKKLQQFAENSNNLRQVWKYMSFKIYSQQDQFMELVKNLPNLIQYHLQQKVMTLSSFKSQECAELFSHQLVTFEIKLILDESNLAQNIEKEDCVGCITYVSPEVQNERLFRIVMNLKGFISKVKKLDQLINNCNLDAELLKFTFDNKSKKITLWSQDDNISYQITRKLTLDDVPQFEQKIYLHSGMIIQLTQNFYLKVNACVNENRSQGDFNQNFTPCVNSSEKIQLKPILISDNKRWISINNGFEDVIYYPNQIPLKISKHQTLPKELEVLLQNDGFGHYIIVVGNCSAFYPRIKSKKSQGNALQLITTQDNFNLGIIYQDNIRLQLSSDLLSVWKGLEIFDL